MSWLVGVWFGSFFWVSLVLAQSERVFCVNGTDKHCMHNDSMGRETERFE